MRGILFFLLFVNSVVYGQTAQVKGSVKDKDSGTEIGFASLQVVGTQSGVVCSSNGDFEISLPHSLQDTLIEVRALGYKSKRMTLAQLSATPIIYLETDPVQLQEVIVKASSRKPLTAKDIEEMVVKVKDGVYFSNTEVSNYLYQYFLAEVCVRNDSLCRIATIDQIVLQDFDLSPEQFMQFFKNKLFEQYPACNMSWQGATLFCSWLTEKYGSFENRKYKQAVFSLPTPEDWTYAARGTGTGKFPWPGDLPFVINKDSSVTRYCNYRDLAREDSSKQVFYAPVKSYYKSKFGLYNVCGNVAEMTSLPDVFMGGSFYSDSTQVGVQRTSDKRVTAPSIYVGFRFVLTN
ncbi:MAG: SUMF1/EgtB/PvdO family nonheme iron enzyme [Chitinophagales bacterium]|nr:SUMF1/EgtB/PvdO family nonheme iron enzyme [Chitinophagales bacterium]